MLIRIGNAVINREEVLFAWIDNDGSIKVQFKDKSSLRITTKEAEEDLSRILSGRVQLRNA